MSTVWIMAGTCGLASLLLAGCGSDTPYSIRPAKGTVKYVDGSLIPAGRIELLFISQQPPVDAKTHPRQGIAEVNVTDGSFIVSTYELNDGLIVGKHKVLAKSIAPAGGYTSAIPRKYHNTKTTPLDVDAEDSPFEMLIELP